VRTPDRSDVAYLSLALEACIEEWCKMANDGDAGKWDPETDRHIILARDALNFSKDCLKEG
jgi:hypothetical protein